MGTTGGEQKKWVLVTGGTRGIGKGLVEAFCRSGYEVVFTFKNSSELASQLEQSMKDIHQAASGYRCDSADRFAVEAFSQKILQEKGAPYALVNNAGITRDALVLRMSDGDWFDVINTNLNASFFMIRFFSPPMVERGEGVILQISSVAGIRGSAGQTNYSATKAALDGMTRSLAVELGRFNIRVNNIAPGYVVTDMVENIPDKEKRSLERSIPLRRMGTVGDVAALALFLASPEASYITGQTFVVDGGLTA